MPEEELTALLRALHTLKGNAGMMGFAALRDYAHAVESVFREPAAEWPQELLDQLFAGAATLRRAVQRLGSTDEQAALGALTALPQPVAGGATPATAADPERDAPPAAGAEERETLELAGTDVLRVPFAKLDTLLNQVGELVGLHAALDDLVSAQREGLDALGLRRPLADRLEQLERITTELRSSAMELRLVPIGRVFRRFPRLARELAREQGKRVAVVLEGEDTELDKSTVDVLAEPLLHLVRNAVDHGIRTPEARRAAGRPPEGTIVLRAAQIGDRVRIDVEDDGVGFDRTGILNRAREAGLHTAAEALSDEELAKLILRPGFSTRRVADTVSGRGIGLDVVSSSVARLRGTLEVGDGASGGARFTLQLPLTLAIIAALLFEAAGETLALPALDVEETLRPGAVGWAAGAEVLALDDELVPLARPARLFGWEPADAPDAGAETPRYLLLVRSGSRSAAVVAERLIDQRDIVVKPLPAYFGRHPAVSGATIAPDGRVVLVLNAGGLIDLNYDSHRRRGRVA